MPELPDVENYCRYLKQHSLHKRIEGVTVRAPGILKGISGRGLGRALEGHTLAHARRHGKHLLVAVDDGHWLAFHFGMTGRFEHFREGEEEPKYDRVRFHFAGGEYLAYVNQRMLGRVELVDDADDLIRSKKLGPDAAAVDEPTFRKRLSDKRGAVKAALMDQSLFAGIGNIYSDEILYQAKIHPRTNIAALDDSTVKQLYRVMRRVLDTAVKRGAGAEDVERRVPKSWLLPHRERGADCPRCGGKIAMLKMQSRTAYFCPRCQRERRRR
ncbi:MAG TPA: DNA-formamidopyrimidine glycosylase family protein [Woeseiaceae bacterium]|nr:DNA-formamidopyrimidine glycosylase family protein [Woeseiaceae bacterium]